MKRARNVLLLIVVVCLCWSSSSTSVNAQTRPTAATTVAVTGPSTAPAVFLAGDNEDEYWIAAVRPTGDAKVPVETTLYRREMGERKFAVVLRLNGRVVDVGQWAGRATVLQDNGQWLTVWPGGTATGAALPAGGTIVALGGNDTDAWAIGAVAGGFDAAKSASATSTRPTTVATTTSLVADVATRFVLFRLDRARWIPVVSLPGKSELVTSIPGSGSILVSGGLVYAAFPDAGGTSLFRFDPSSSTLTGPTKFPESAVDLFTGAYGEPLAWRRTGQTGAGPVVRLDGNETPVARVGQIDPSSLPRSLDAHVGAALGYLRLLGVGDNGDVIEQRADWNGKPIGAAESIESLPAPDAVPPWSKYVNVTIITLLAVALLASFRHKEVARDALARRDRPRPARVWVRTCAAIVDLIPVIVGVVVIYWRAKPGQVIPADIGTTIPVLIGVGVYLLHTTISELLTRRTLGKLIFGLTVVNFAGEPPSTGAILIRNALRIVDLAMLPPLLIILVLLFPFRQRIGDIAAGTVVVDVAAPKMTDAVEEDE
jgi:uncharacterized RDD family membrane protein YckC